MIPFGRFSCGVVQESEIVILYLKLAVWRKLDIKNSIALTHDQLGIPSFRRGIITHLYRLDELFGSRVIDTQSLSLIKATLSQEIVIIICWNVFNPRISVCNVVRKLILSIFLVKTLRWHLEIIYNVGFRRLNWSIIFRSWWCSYDND